MVQSLEGRLGQLKNNIASRDAKIASLSNGVISNQN